MSLAVPLHEQMTRTAWLKPATVGLAALGVCVAVNVRDPNGAGSFGMCPFLFATGLQCPGCGTLRAVRAFTRGDILMALDLNVLSTVLLPILVVAWVSWLLVSLGRRDETMQLPAWAGTAVALFVPVFWVARNTPWLAVLAP